MPPLNLSKLTQAFEPSTRKRGEEYARSGAVTIRRKSALLVTADVVGTSVYDVVLRYDEGELFASCDCPSFEREGDLCKHIWATLIECQTRNIKWDREILDIYPDDEAIEAFDDDEDDEVWYDEEVIPSNVVSLAQRRLPTNRRWRQQLQYLGYSHVPDVHPPPPEIIWVLDSVRDDEFLIQITSRPLKKNGEPGKPQKLRIDANSVAQMASPADREIIALLMASQPMYGLLDSEVSFGPLVAPYILPKLVATGRLWVRRGNGEYATDVTFDTGAPWRLHLEAVERNDHYVLEGFFRRGEESVPVRETLGSTKSFVFFTKSIAPFDGAATHRWADLVRRETVEVQRSEVAAFREAVASSHSPVRVSFPDDIQWKERYVAPSASIELGPAESFLRGRPVFTYEESPIEAFDHQPAQYDEATKTYFNRDTRTESQLMNALWAQGFTRKGDYVLIPASRSSNAIANLIDAGWKVSGDGGVYSGFGDLDLQIRSGIDWFDLDATATFGEERVRLPQLLAALRRGDSSITLDGGQIGMIRPEWKMQLEPFLAAAFEEQESGLRFRSNQVLLLDVLLAQREAVSFDEVFETARRRILERRVAPEMPPSSFHGVLRPYQTEALGWFSFLRDLGFGGCLADDMGLGKTVQVLALLEQRRVSDSPDRRPSLVVAPRSVLFNWKSEAEKFTPELRVLDHGAADRERSTEHFKDYDVILTTYALLRRDIAVLSLFEFDYAILDESQAIKNAASQSAKAATLIKARHRLALSGTPVENHLGELGSLFEFLNPGMLRSRTSRMTSMLRAAGGKTADAGAARVMLAKAVRPFILRRTKGQVATELPDRVEQTIFCELEPPQRRLYDELRLFYRASLLGRVAEKGMARSKIHVLEALLRMRQAACHPGLVDAKRVDEPSAKLETLFEELPILIEEKHKVLVFSQFTSLLAIVRKGMEEREIAYAYLDGSTRDRETQVRRFQEDPDVSVFLISLKAGGLGLNLTAAEYVFLLDPWWNPAVEAQAIDRAHRIGQTRNVFAYRLVARDTIEEKILQLQQSKRDLADAIISAENSLLRELTPEDLDLLLS